MICLIDICIKEKIKRSGVSFYRNGFSHDRVGDDPRGYGTNRDALCIHLRGPSKMRGTMA